MGKWAYVNPAILNAANPVPGGTMLMAVAAKKHLTLFARSRHAPGAGSPERKRRFADAAHGTKGVASRMARNEAMSRALR